MEAIESHLKPWGRYQAFVFALLFLPPFEDGIQSLIYSFSGAIPNNRCALPGIDNDTSVYDNQFVLDNLNYFYNEPFVEEGHKSYCAYCEQNLMNYIGANTTTNLNTTCNSNTVKQCQSHIYDTSQFLSTVTSKFDMVCETGAVEQEITKSLYLVGIAIGSAGSSLADRKTILVIVGLLQLITTNITPLMPNIESFIVMQVINGAVSHAAFLISMVMVVELCKGIQRSVAVNVMQLYYSAGYLAVGLVAYLERDWRIQRWILSCFSILYLLYIWILPESFHWLIVNVKYERAKKQLLRASKMNSIVCSESEAEKIVTGAIASKQAEEHVPLKALFSNRSLIKRTLILFLCWMSSTMAYWGISLNTGDLPGDDYLNYALVGLIELPAYLICMPMLEYWGRKPSLICLFAIAGVSCIITGLVPQDSVALVLTFTLIGKLGAAGTTGVVYVYTTELFPTIFRNAGIGACSFFGRLGAVSAPQIHLLAEFVDVWLPMVIYGAFSCLAAVLAFWLPETKGQTLPDTAAETLDPNAEKRQSDGSSTL